MTTYRVFKRAARSFEEFANAEKRHVEGGLSYAEALAQCAGFNAQRSEDEVERGVKFEFEEG